MGHLVLLLLFHICIYHELLDVVRKDFYLLQNTNWDIIFILIYKYLR
jgi:hypothetical protein